MNRVSQALLLAGLATSLAACNEDDGRPTYRSFDTNLLDTVVADPDLSTFVELATVAGIEQGLAGGTVLTLFAPTNAAFSAVPAATLQALRDDPEQLSAVLRYHVLGGSWPASLVTNTSTSGSGIMTATGQMIGVGRSGGNIVLQGGQMSSAMLVSTDTYASNGIVHKIDSVLLPPPAPMPPMPMDIPGTLGMRGFTALGMALPMDIAMALAGDGPFTVFAPSDAAFMALGDISGVDAGVVENILLSHVVMGDVPSSAVLVAASFTNLAGTALEVGSTMAGPTIGGAALDTANLDITATNGRIHGLSEVIIPPTIVEVAASTPALSTLVQAVGNAGLAGALTPSTLTGAAPITVFAPTNAAFAADMIDPAMVGTSTLTAVLQHHVVAGQALSSSLSEGQTITTLNGTLTVTSTGTPIVLTDGSGNTANVVGTDIRTVNGVVHLIDSVLTPM